MVVMPAWEEGRKRGQMIIDSTSHKQETVLSTNTLNKKRHWRINKAITMSINEN